MISRSSFVPFVLASFASFATACSSAEDAAPASGDDGESEAEIRASCTNPKRYYVASRNGPCDTIDGEHGRWVPEAGPAFPDAPREVQESTCVVRWTTTTKASPDKNALDAAVGTGIAPACGAGASPDFGEVVKAPPPNIILGGSVGCDVCGILKSGHVWVVLPPNGVRQFTVPLSNGTFQSFAIKPSASPALSISLPPPPAGAKYRDGVVKIL